MPRDTAPRTARACDRCRVRKLKCDGVCPCAQCTLHKRTAHCQYSQGAPIEVPAAPPPVDGPRRSATPPNSSPEYKHDAIKSSTWNQLLNILPLRSDCEILLDFLLLECDWLCPVERIVGCWETAISSQACTATQGALFTVHILTASVLLQHLPSMLYRPSSLESKIEILFDHAWSAIWNDDKSLDKMELLVYLNRYVTYSGHHSDRVVEVTRTAVALAKEGGWLDETSAFWNNIGDQERQQRRLLCNHLITACRWQLAFALGDPLVDARINVCRSNAPLCLERPLNLKGLRTGDVNSSFRVFRVKSQQELELTRRYLDLVLDIRDLFPRLRRFHKRLSHLNTLSDQEAVIDECQDLIRELTKFQRDILPSNGFPIPGLFDANDPLACRMAAQSLNLHNIISHMVWCVLRRWPAINLPRPQCAVLHQFRNHNIANARLAIQFSHTLHTLMSTRLSAYNATASVINLSHAATTLAAPVLHHARLWGKSVDLNDICPRPIWPALPDVELDLEGLSPHDITNVKTPSHIRQLAIDVLRVLDILSSLGSSPLSQAAESRVRRLVVKYRIDTTSQALASTDDGVTSGTSVEDNYGHIANPAPLSQADQDLLMEFLALEPQS